MHKKMLYNIIKIIRKEQRLKLKTVQIKHMKK